MKKLKFAEVKKLVEDKTYNTVTVSKKVDARHKGKYVLKNIVTHNVSSVSFKTLQEVLDYLGINKRLEELLEKKFLTDEEFNELCEMEQIEFYEDCGISGNYAGMHYWNFITSDGNEYDIYTE